jgi:putative ABC transport system permease protein
MLQDLRYTVRTLAKSPGFTLIVVLTLALGVGANTAIFSVVKAVLLTPLPYREPERLVQVWEHNIPRGIERNVVSPANYLDWRDRATSFADMAMYSMTGIAFTGETATFASGRAVTTNLFDLLGARPMLGRGFVPADGDAGAPRTLILSHGLWTRQFGRDPAIVGATVPIAGGSALVVGVMPPTFRPLGDEEYWEALGVDPAMRQRQGRGAWVIARLKDGVTPGQAHAELRGIAAALEREYPAFNTAWSANVVPLVKDIVRDADRVLFMLMGAAGAVLLIACANVGNLLLTRAAARQRELALRASLGASVSRLVRLWLTETLLLTLIGAAAGVALAAWGLELLRTLAPADLPRLDEVRLDGRVLAFTLGVALLVALGLGLAATLGVGTHAPLAAMTGGDLRTTATRGSRRFRDGLVVAQVSLALVLLVGAGLVLRSLVRLYQVDPGFETERVVTARVGLPDALYPDPAKARFFHEFADRVRALPGVEAAGVVSALPLTGIAAATSFRATDRPDPPAGQSPVADIRAADNGYFSTLRIPLLRGRPFESTERAGAAVGVIVSQTLVRDLWPGGDPIGKQLRVNWLQPGEVTIIGVVGDVRHRGLDVAPRQTIYYHVDQSPTNVVSIAVRGRARAQRLAAEVRAVLRELDDRIPLRDPRTMEERIAASVGGRRYPMLLLGLFAAVALTLAAIGLYGVLSYTVGLRTREIGVRVALGAMPGMVLWMVVRRGLVLVGWGLALGIAVAAVATRVLRNLLYEVSPTDPVAFIAMAAVLAGAGLLASFVPARRAAQVDPMVALRTE